MKHYAALRIRVEKDIVTRVIRLLNGKGQFKVNVGQEVTPDEIIGRVDTTSGYRTLNLATELAADPREVGKYLKRTLGQKIYKGELLAYKAALFKKRVVIAPTDGILEFLDPHTGELKISFLPKKTDLPAGVYGIVEAIDGEKGQVTIRTQVSRIHGIFGSGRLRDGMLHILNKRDDFIYKNMIEPKYNGFILVGGSLFFKDTLLAAVTAGVNGIITGGIDAGDYKTMASARLIFPKKLDTDVGISIIVCEGFGGIPIGEDIFSVFMQHEGKFVFIDGNKSVVDLPSGTSSSLIRVRNTELPPLQDGELSNVTQYSKFPYELKIGSRVRIVGNAYSGEQGTLIAVDNTQTLLPSKIKAYLATIEGKRRKIQVPVANIEVIM